MTTRKNLIVAASDLFAALKDVEWAGIAYDEEDGDEVSACPWCEAEERDGKHADHCKLAQAIAKAEGRAK